MASCSSRSTRQPGSCHGHETSRRPDCYHKLSSLRRLHSSGQALSETKDLSVPPERSFAEFTLSAAKGSVIQPLTRLPASGESAIDLLHRPNRVGLLRS